MTNEEAIADLKASEKWKCKPSSKCIDKAIKTLEQQPEDAISRRKAINVISACDGKSSQIEALEKLPPVQPKIRTGSWIYRNFNWHCSECCANCPSTRL